MVSVNLSVHQFRNPGLTERIAQTLAATGLEPSSLRIEITETVLMEDGVSALSTLQALRDLGIRLAIDDFGTGYSSLSYLQRFPVDTIKLDRSFVTGIVRDETTQAIVRAVASLGHGLHLQVTAEGIETAEQWAQVYGAGCRYAQGYYFAPPLPAVQMEALLNGGAGRFRPSREIERRARHRAETRWHDRRALLTDDVLRLPEEFAGVFSAETVERFTRVALESLEGSRVQAYLSTLVGRTARESLRALAITDRIPSGQRATILFVCVTGAGASPMAAALAQHLSDGWIRARAVGSSPAEALDPLVVRAMSEIGIDLPREAPWPLTEEDVLATDVIVTLGCGDVCPLLPEKRYRDWDIAAPDGMSIERVREIRETLRTRVRHLLSELGLVRAA
jgi:protein-tyrosine-phosphatase